jgi:DNA-binding winged helix-turn-helix (wHTH) protein
MRVRFGSFLFDSATRTLSRGGEPVALSPKAFALLELLIEASPAAVSKDALYERLWPDTYVEQGNLHNLVSEIRAAIGDHDHEILRTVHRFGYAFAAVRTMTANASAFAVIAGSEQIPLHEGSNTIGRDSVCEIVINAPDVSRQHARLIVEGDALTLEDLGSKNGTFLGTTPVTKRVEVRDTDEIMIGRNPLRLRRVQQLATTKTAL